MKKKLLKKFKAIERHQQAVKDIIQDIEDENLWLVNLEDPKDGWTWSMCIDNQGSVTSASDAERLFKMFEEYKNKDKK